MTCGFLAPGLSFHQLPASLDLRTDLTAHLQLLSVRALGSHSAIPGTPAQEVGCVPWQ